MRRIGWISLALGVVLAMAAGVLATRMEPFEEQSPADGGGSVALEGRGARDCGRIDPWIDEIRATLLRGSPGVSQSDGLIDGSPIATALVLTAEASCVRESLTMDSTVVDSLGEALLAQDHLAPSRQVGLESSVGNPGSLVAEAISASIVVNALLDWHDVASPGRRERISIVVSDAVTDWMAEVPRLKGLMSGDELAVDAFGAAALLSGQMRRVATMRLPQEDSVADSADVLMSALIGARRIDAAGNWFWPSADTRSASSSLISTGRIIDGVTTYVRHGGSLAPSLPIDAIVGRLSAFQSDGRSDEPWLSHPVLVGGQRRGQDQPVPLGDVGWTLMTIARQAEPSEAITDSLCAMARRYRAGQGELRLFPADLIVPSSSDANSAEQRAMLYAGLVGLGAFTCSRPLGSPNWVALPFTGLRAGDEVFDIEVDPTELRARLRSSDEQLDLPLRGVPLSLDEHAGLRVAMSRRVADGSLVFARWNGDLALPAVTAFGGRRDVDYRGSVATSSALFVLHEDLREQQLVLSRHRWPDLVTTNEWSLPGGDGSPALLVAGGDEKVRVVAPGTLFEVDAGELVVRALRDCEVPLEAVAGPAAGSPTSVLCRNRSGVYDLFQVGAASLERHPIETVGVPFDLHVDDVTGDVAWADSARSPAALVRFEIGRLSRRGGMLLGAGNEMGLAADVQLPFLDALLDIVEAERLGATHGRFAKLTKDAVQRVSLELAFLEGTTEARGFERRSESVTTDGSPALLAADTARLSSVMHRYLDPRNLGGRTVVALPELRSFASRSRSLEGHAELVDVDEVMASVPFLRWRRGSAVQLDGANVPFALQNEWAGAVLSDPSSASGDEWDAAREMVSFFYGRIADHKTGGFSAESDWSAWWGLGAEGWTADADVSVNTPVWGGDHRPANEEERSIDAAALLAWSTVAPPDVAGPLRSSVRRMVSEGNLLPRVAGDLWQLGEVAELPTSAMAQYGRSAVAADLEDLVWVQALLIDG